VGSVACAIGWSAACLACLALAAREDSNTVRLTVRGKMVAAFGLLVGIAMILMKVLPFIPGHFNGYEWIAFAVWIAVGVTAARVNVKDCERVESKV